MLKVFASMFISEIGVVFFFRGIFVLFWYQGDSGLIVWVWECFSAIFWNSFRRIGVSFSLNGLIEFSCEAIWSWTFFLFKVLFICFFFAFLGPYLWHMEVSRLGGESEL